MSTIFVFRWWKSWNGLVFPTQQNTVFNGDYFIFIFNLPNKFNKNEQGLNWTSVFTQILWIKTDWMFNFSLPEQMNQNIVCYLTSHIMLFLHLIAERIFINEFEISFSNFIASKRKQTHANVFPPKLLTKVHKIQDTQWLIKQIKVSLYS